MVTAAPTRPAGSATPALGTTTRLTERLASAGDLLDCFQLRAAWIDRRLGSEPIDLTADTISIQSCAATDRHVVAVRGDRLALYRLGSDGGAPGVLSLVESDADGLVRAESIWDGDRLAEALAALDERYLESEGAAVATGARPLLETVRSLSRGEWVVAPLWLAAGFTLDTTRLGRRSIGNVDAHQLVSAIRELGDVELRVPALVALSRSVVVGRIEIVTPGQQACELIAVTRVDRGLARDAQLLPAGADAEAFDLARQLAGRVADTATAGPGEHPLLDSVELALSLDHVTDRVAPSAGGSNAVGADVQPGQSASTTAAATSTAEPAHPARVAQPHRSPSTITAATPSAEPTDPPRADEQPDPLAPDTVEPTAEETNLANANAQSERPAPATAATTSERTDLGSSDALPGRPAPATTATVSTAEDRTSAPNDGPGLEQTDSRAEPGALPVPDRDERGSAARLIGDHDAGAGRESRSGQAATAPGPSGGRDGHDRSAIGVGGHDAAGSAIEPQAPRATAGSPEASTDAAPPVDNALTTGLRAGVAQLVEGDLDAFLELFDVALERADRRAVVAAVDHGGRDDLADGLRAVLGVTDRVATSLIATAGERHAVVELTFSSEGLTIDFLAVVEAGDDGRVTRLSQHDTEDRDEAVRLMREWATGQPAR